MRTIVTSVRILYMALLYQSAYKLTQMNLPFQRSQAPLIGLHCSNVAVVKEMPAHTTTNINAKHSRENQTRSVKMRR